MNQLAYNTKESILAFVTLFRPDFTAEIDIPDALLTSATNRVNVALLMQGIYGTVTDYAGILAQAELFYYLETAQMVRQFESSFGVVNEVKAGNWVRKYENSTPMFFFAQGGNERFIQLLPHLTWQMQANMAVNAYVTWYTKVNSSGGEYGAIQQDVTPRGYGWDSNVTGTIGATGLWPFIF